MITQSDIDTLTQRIDSLEATVKQLTGALVELSQKAGETAGRVDRHMAEPHYIPAKSTDAAAMYKTVSKTMIECINNDIKFHGGEK